MNLPPWCYSICGVWALISAASLLFLARMVKAAPTIRGER